MGLQPNTKAKKKKKLNITFHSDDSWVPAEWHFFVTSRGKSFNDEGMQHSKMACHKNQFSATTETPLLYEWTQSSKHNLNVKLWQIMNIKKSRVC